MLLGYTQEGGQVALSPQGRRQGTYVIGINGTGKSTLLLNIALADIRSGAGLCLLDPHGDLIEKVLLNLPEEMAERVILFDPSDIEHPFGLNLFECRDRGDPRLVDRVCSEIVGTFHKLFAYSWGPHLEDLLRHAVMTLIYDDQSTLLDVLLLLSSEKARAQYVRGAHDPILASYWRDRFPARPHDQGEWVASTLNKVGRFLVNPLIRNIVSQRASTFALEDVMNQGKVLLVNLSKGKIGEDNSALLGSVLVGKLLVAALTRAEQTEAERRPFHLIVDEYQSFATESFPTLQSEARKFAIDTIVAHQYRDQLDLLNKGSSLNVGNVVVFRVTGPDGDELAKQFDNTPPQPELERQPMIYPTSREGVYRTGDHAEYVLIAGRARTYSDVWGQKANHLANLPNYKAVCKLVEGNRMGEYEILAASPPTGNNVAVAEAVRRRSRALAKPRAEIERAITERIATLAGEDLLQGDEFFSVQDTGPV